MSGFFGATSLSKDGRYLFSVDYPANPYPEVFPRIYDTTTGKQVILFDSNGGLTNNLVAADANCTLLVQSGMWPESECYSLYAYRRPMQKQAWEASGFIAKPEGADESMPDPSAAPITSVDVFADGKWVAVVTRLGVFVLDGRTGNKVFQPR